MDEPIVQFRSNIINEPEAIHRQLGNGGRKLLKASSDQYLDPHGANGACLASIANATMDVYDIRQGRMAKENTELRIRRTSSAAPQAWLVAARDILPGEELYVSRRATNHVTGETVARARASQSPPAPTATPAHPTRNVPMDIERSKARKAVDRRPILTTAAADMALMTPLQR